MMQRRSTEPATGSPHFSPETVRITYRSGYDGIEDWAIIEPGRTATWVIVLHGHGSHGDQIFTRPDIAAIWLPCVRKHGLGILSPNLRDDAWMCRPAVEDLHELLGFVRENYPFDRFIIASGSMGGTGSLIYTINHPEDISATIAFCPATDIGSYYNFCRANTGQLPVLDEIGTAIETAYGGTPETVPDRYAANSAVKHAARLTMPVCLCHGDNDAIIPVENSRKLVAELEKNGSNYRYKELPDGHHDSPLQHYPEALEWLMGRLG